MKRIFSILLIIFMALAGIACVNAYDINETVDQDLIVSDLNETLIPIDESTVLNDTDLGNETEEDQNTEIDNSTEPSEEDVVVDNSTEVVENDTVDNEINPIVGPKIADKNETEENQSSQGIKVLTDDELNAIANETIAHFMEKREYWVNCNYPPQWGINPDYEAVTSLSLDLNKTYGADNAIDILTRMYVMVLLDESPTLSLMPSSLKTLFMPALIYVEKAYMDYIIRSYWDTISKKSSNYHDGGLDSFDGSGYDPRFDADPRPSPSEELQ